MLPVRRTNSLPRRCLLARAGTRDEPLRTSAWVANALTGVSVIKMLYCSAKLVGNLTTWMDA